MPPENPGKNVKAKYSAGGTGMRRKGGTRRDQKIGSRQKVVAPGVGKEK